MTTIVRTTSDEAETIALGRDVGRRMRPGDVVALSGELGAGKTRFVRGVAAGLGVDPGAVSSPTFVMINEYPGGRAAEGGAPLTRVHVDAHRLSGPGDLDSLGWDEATAGDVALVVEWAERIAPALPADRLDVVIEHAPGERRRITMTGRGGWAGRLGGLGEAPLTGAPAARAVSEGAAKAAHGGASGAAHRCPACAAEVAPDAPAFPFCSPRCRMADLGKWFSGDYVISRRIEERDLDDGE